MITPAVFACRSEARLHLVPFRCAFRCFGPSERRAARHPIATFLSTAGKDRVGSGYDDALRRPGCPVFKIRSQKLPVR